jgi:hypothetical protein
MGIKLQVWYSFSVVDQQSSLRFDQQRKMTHSSETVPDFIIIQLRHRYGLNMDEHLFIDRDETMTLYLFQLDKRGYQSRS